MRSFLARGSLEVLRAEAKDELDAIMAIRCRAGEDPWEFASELPTTDQLVVLALVADVLESEPNVERRDADSILRQIAVQVPELRPAVWPLLGTVAA